MRLWILAITTSIVITMGLGGLTRLTESGLSIVEWKPISGVIPPLNEAQWETAFKDFQQYSDFKSRPSMTLPEFKAIFWWEFLHRLAGRAIVLVILLPYFYFWRQKQLQIFDHKKVIVLLTLVATQGALGWFMVTSGLKQIPRVSHLRLMVHFIWACLILAYLARWLSQNSSPKNLQSTRSFLKALSGLWLMQLALGALVAGTRAGFIHNTFPMMGTHWLPEKFFLSESLFENFIYNQINLQFFHRTVAWALSLFAFTALLRRDYLVAGLIILQFILGVSTLVLLVPPLLATAHQATGVLIFFFFRFLATSAAPQEQKSLIGASYVI